MFLTHVGSIFIVKTITVQSIKPIHDDFLWKFACEENLKFETRICMLTAVVFAVTACRNERDDMMCMGWAQMGQCQRARKQMFIYCKRTCSFCEARKCCPSFESANDDSRRIHLFFLYFFFFRPSPKVGK